MPKSGVDLMAGLASQTKKGRDGPKSFHAQRHLVPACTGCRTVIKQRGVGEPCEALARGGIRLGTVKASLDSTSSLLSVDEDRNAGLPSAQQVDRRPRNGSSSSPSNHLGAASSLTEAQAHSHNHSPPLERVVGFSQPLLQRHLPGRKDEVQLWNTGSSPDGTALSFADLSNVVPLADPISDTVCEAIEVLLHPAPTRPLLHGWSPDEAAFREQVSSLFPRPSKSKRHIEELRRFLRPTLPALLDESILRRAEHLLGKSQLDQIAFGNDWLSLLLIITALGHELMVFRGDRSDDEMGWTSFNSNPRSENQHDPHQYSNIMLSATNHALNLASYQESLTLQAIFAQLLMGLLLIHTERAADFWPILGGVVRQAQAMGLDADPVSTLSSDSDSDEHRLRQRLWWALVQEDVLLSSIFGRPLAISCFSRKVPHTQGSEPSTQCLDVHAHFSCFERRHLLEDLYQGWNGEQLERFRFDLFTWYARLPATMRVYIDDQGAVQGDSVTAQMISRSVNAVEATVDQFIKLQYTILSLFRMRMHSQCRNLSEASHMICAQAVHNILLSLQAIVELLGTPQAGSVWLRTFYAFHSGITAAYITRSRPNTPLAERAREDLRQLQKVCQRLPQRWKGLETAKATFATLIHNIDAQQNRCTDVDTIGCDSDTSQPVEPDSHNSMTMVDPTRSFDDALADHTMQPKTVTSWPSAFPEPFGAFSNPHHAEGSEAEILAYWSEFFSIRLTNGEGGLAQ